LSPNVEIPTGYRSIENSTFARAEKPYGSRFAYYPLIHTGPDSGPSSHIYKELVLMSNTQYQKITDRIMDMLKAGVIPWRKPWVNGSAVNWNTQKPYRGINALLLEPGEYATFLQIKKAGGRIKAGEKHQIAVFWDRKPDKDIETGEPTGEYYSLLVLHQVFEINTQCTGMKSKRENIVIDNDPIAEAEKIVQGYKGAPPIRFKPGRAVYKPKQDVIDVPEINDFPIVGEYYSTLFHEMVHSTGHPDRLNRPGVANFDTFGSEQYSKEELIAEMGAAMLCGNAGIDHTTIENSASYIGSWLRKLENDPKLVVQAASQAQKAADLILGVKFDSKEDGEEEGAAA
jgi:antirestriction protein ArdC